MILNSCTKYCSLVLLLISFSCSNEKQEIETVDFEDFLPKSERDYDYDKEEESVEVEIEINPTIKMIGELLNVDFVQPEKGRHFPNRFSYRAHEDFFFVSKDDTIHYSHWYYEDSLRTTSTLFNWMDCFGKECQSLRFKEEISVKSPKYFGLWATDTALIFVYSDNRFNIKTWNNTMEKVYFLNTSPNYHFYQMGREIIWWEDEE